LVTHFKIVYATFRSHDETPVYPLTFTIVLPFINFPLMKKVINENKKSAKTDICIKNQ